MDDWVSVVDDERDRAVATERIVILLCLMRVVPSDDLRVAVRALGIEFAKRWAETLQTLFRKLAPHDAAHRSGLVSMCVETARLFGKLLQGMNARSKALLLCYAATSSVSRL